MDTSQYLSMFLDESMDNLQTLNEALLNLEQNPNDIEMLNQIFRVAHTIKGMAATMGFTAMAELTHKMEDVLSNFREGKLEVSENVVTVLFNCLDTLETMVNNIEAGVDDEVDVTDIVQSLGNIVNGLGGSGSHQSGTEQGGKHQGSNQARSEEHTSELQSQR